MPTTTQGQKFVAREGAASEGGLTEFPPPPSPENTSETSENAARTADLPAPSGATEAVLMPSEPVPKEWEDRKVRGIDFNDFKGKEVTVTDLVNGMEKIGFQASGVAKAVRMINEMVWTLSKRSAYEADPSRKTGDQRKVTRRPSFSDIHQISSPPASARQYATSSSTSTSLLL